MSVNKVILVGNVGQDPEIRHLDSGVAVASFTLATSETYTKDGERITNTEWHNIVAWRGLAGVVENYVKKGSKLYIEGKITHRQYEKDGQTKYFTEIVANNMVMLDSKKDSTNTGNTSYSKPAAPATTPTTKPVEPETDDADADDLPF